MAKETYFRRKNSSAVSISQFLSPGLCFCFDTVTQYTGDGTNILIHDADNLWFVGIRV